MSMKSGLPPCPVSVANLVYVQEQAADRAILNEFLGEGADMGVTITNLENLLNHVMQAHMDTPSEPTLSQTVLFNARRALVSLSNLTTTMEE